MFDEVQAGMGRTGKWFSHQHWPIQPDVMTLSKALAGGIAAGAMLARPEFADKLVPGTHAATFGGNPIACTAALAYIETIDADNLLPQALKIGERFAERFNALRKRCPLIQDIRIKGAMIGVELAVDGTPIVARCLERRLLINCTHGTVLRLLPALNLPEGLLDEGCAILEEVLCNT
jgi:acetylornithine/succinyldiaminopimelate/putrescine aminotransferase